MFNSFLHFCKFNENSTNIFDTADLFKTKYSIVVIYQTFKTINKIHTFQTHCKELYV